MKCVPVQWRILIWRSGPAEGYNAALWTLLLDLTSGSGFATGAGGFYTGIKCSEREADQSLSYKREFKNEREI
jgi:hypothetical protein